MYCTKCGAGVSREYTHCLQCESAFENRCSACGMSNSASADFCGNCGQPIASQPLEATETVESTWGQAGAGEPAERRQLTVLFCDLVGSTSLSERLDPEELLRVLRSFHKVCREPVDRYGGHVAQYLGDGVLIYFGHPVAHENDSQLAVYTALDIQSSMKNLSHTFLQEGGGALSLRMGIHTGEVIVGRQQLAVGQTPNVAARIQSLADPDTIVMTAVTYKLVEPFFTCKDLGEHRLKGLERQFRMYRVDGKTEAKTTFQASGASGMMPLEGREKEKTLLRESWERTCEGNGEAILVRGEPGIGKSRLLEVFKNLLSDESPTLLECYCLAYDQHTPFAPISYLLRQVLGFHSSDSPSMRLAKLSAAMERLDLVPEQIVPLLAPILSLKPEAGYTPLEMEPMIARQLTLNALTTCLLGTTKTFPVVILIEDLHWMDPSSLDLIGMILSQIGTFPLFMLLTGRPEFVAKWPDQKTFSEIPLTRLTPEETASLATHVAHNRALPPEVLKEIVKRTDGVPLFVEELTKYILETGLLKPVNGSYKIEGPLPTGAIPTTVRGSLMARLDRLDSAKRLAQVGAVIGRDFRHDVLLAVAKLSEVEVERDLTRLIESDLISREGLPPKATYTFRHALVQEAAYKSLLEGTRVLYHERIAGVLFEKFPEIEQNQPELLAQHYSNGGAARQAITYWKKAGKGSMERSANQEASAHFQEGLDLLPRLPDDESRLSLEVELQVQFGLSLTGSSGYAVPQVGEAYQRARELCEILGNPVELYPVLRNLMNFYIVRDDLVTAKELCEQCLRLGQETQKSEYLIEGYVILGYTLSYIGELKEGNELLEKALEEYRSRDGKRLQYTGAQDPAVASWALMGLNLGMLGDPDHANQCLEKSLNLAEELHKPFNVVYAHAYAAMFHNILYRFEKAIYHAEVTMEISNRHGIISWLTWGGMHKAIANGRLGNTEESIVPLTNSLGACQAIGAEIATSYFLGELAEIYQVAGRFDEALNTVEKAIVHAHEHGELWYESVLFRLRGNLLAYGGAANVESAEADLTRAVEISKKQGTKLFELQAALKLYSLGLKNGRSEPLRGILNAAVESFGSAVVDIPELQEAKELLSKGNAQSS